MLTLCNNLNYITFNDNVHSQMCSVKFSFILQSILNANCILTEPWLKVGSVLKWHFVSEFWRLQHRLNWTSSFTAWAAALHQLPMNTPDRLQRSWRHPYRRLWLAETLWAEIGGHSLAFWFCPSPPHVLRPLCQKSWPHSALKQMENEIFRDELWPTIDFVEHHCITILMCVTYEISLN